MYWESALGSAIEVAIAIAGFSGIVAAVGRRAEGGWTASDQLNLWILLTASGATIFFAFLPFILLGPFEPAAAWRVGSGLFALYLFGIHVYRLRQASKLGGEGEKRIRLRLVPQPLVAVAMSSNAIWFAEPWLYLFGVAWGVFVAFITFVALLLGSWHESSESPPAG
jgi:hypothetical protein